MVTRVEGWEGRLAESIEVARNRPFKWGEHDCAIFAANVIEQLLGVDVAAEWRGYKNEAEAKTIVAHAGGMVALADRIFPERLPAKCAQRGDLLLVDSLHESWEGAFAICVGPFGAIPGLRGLVLAPMATWRCAWKVR